MDIIMVTTFETLKKGDTVWKVGEDQSNGCSTDIYKIDKEPSFIKKGLRIKLKLSEDGGCKEKFSRITIPTSWMTMSFFNGFVLNEKDVDSAKGLFLTMIDIFNGNI